MRVGVEGEREVELRITSIGELLGSMWGEIKVVHDADEVDD